MKQEAPGWIEGLLRWLGRVGRELEEAPSVHWYVGEGSCGPWRWSYQVRVQTWQGGLQTLEGGPGCGRGLAPVRRR